MADSADNPDVPELLGREGGREVWRTRSAEATRALGGRWAAGLRAGDVVALDGELGAGKTHFVQGVCRGLEVEDLDRVASPTFILCNEYGGGRLPVMHLDAYRLENGRELWDLGWDEMVDAGGVVLLEWAGRVAEVLPAGALRVEMSHAGGDERRVLLPVLAPRSEPPRDGAGGPGA